MYMCYSAESSLVAFTVGIVGASLCISLRTKQGYVIGLFFAFISLIQVMEYVLWTHPVCDDYHKTVSVIGMALNHAQPIVFGILMLLFYPTNPNRIWIMAIMGLYTASIIPYSLKYVYDTTIHCTKKNKYNHLYWEWNYMKNSGYIYVFSYLVALCSISLLGFDKIHGIWFALVAFITYFTSAFLFYRQQAVGSLWCFYSVLIPIIYYGLCKNDYI